MKRSMFLFLLPFLLVVSIAEADIRKEGVKCELFYPNVSWYKKNNIGVTETVAEKAALAPKTTVTILKVVKDDSAKDSRVGQIELAIDGPDYPLEDINRSCEVGPKDQSERNVELKCKGDNVWGYHYSVQHVFKDSNGNLIYTSADNDQDSTASTLKLFARWKEASSTTYYYLTKCKPHFIEMSN